MRNIKLIIEYDGTNYAGWQVQKNAVSVQQVLEECIESTTGIRASLTGAGRTDSGVHALGQTANFFTASSIPAEKIPQAFNSCLPQDIRIVAAEIVDEGFHSRYSARAKKYRYQVINNEYGSALYHRYYWHVKQTLNLENMKKSAEFLMGTHDFNSFRSSGSNAASSVRTVEDIIVEKSGDIIFIQIIADGFLYNMVRIITGTLIQMFGIKKYTPDYMKEILLSRDRKRSGITAPPQGLFLVEVFY